MSLDLVKNIYLFSNFDESQLKKVSATGEVDVLEDGAKVFAEGDSAKALYIVKYGIAHVLQDTSEGDQVEIAKLGEGSHFGEMAFLDGEPRSATVLSVGKTELLRIDYDKLQKVLDEDNIISARFYQSLAKFLCGRLRTTTQDLSAARQASVGFF